MMLRLLAAVFGFWPANPTLAFLSAQLISEACGQISAYDPELLRSQHLQFLDKKIAWK
jgi:hypothetical protein